LREEHSFSSIARGTRNARQNRQSVSLADAPLVLLPAPAPERYARHR
jgi:hypothetical protein